MAIAKLVISVIAFAFSLFGFWKSERGDWGRDEPQFVLRLSWLALSFAAFATLPDGS